MQPEIQSATARSVLEIMEEARGLQSGHGSHLIAVATGSLRRLMARVLGEPVRHGARDPA